MHWQFQFAGEAQSGGLWNLAFHEQQWRKQQQAPRRRQSIGIHLKDTQQNSVDAVMLHAHTGFLSIELDRRLCETYPDTKEPEVH